MKSSSQAGQSSICFQRQSSGSHASYCQDRVGVLSVRDVSVGGRSVREFNRAQVLTLNFCGATVKIANVHLPSSRKHPKKDLDVTYALLNLSGIDPPSGSSGVVAFSHDAGPPTHRIIVGDINERQMHNMPDRLRMADGGAGRWRHWQTEKSGHGDHVVYESSLERVKSVVDEQWKFIYAIPHHPTGGFFAPSTAKTDQMVQDVLRHVVGDAANMARHTLSYGVGRHYRTVALSRGAWHTSSVGWNACAA